MYHIAKESVGETSLEPVTSSQVESRFDKLRFMKQLLIGAPQIVGVRRAWDIYQDLLLGERPEYLTVIYGDSLDNNVLFENIDDFKQVYRQSVALVRRDEEKSKAPKRRKATAENEGYSEPQIEPEISHWKFQPNFHLQTLVDDNRKSDYYTGLAAFVDRHVLPRGQPIDCDKFVSVFKRALGQHLLNQNRPVLTNELADFNNPYMMRRSAMERLLRQKCARNKLDEVLIENYLNADKTLLQLQSRASIPPEVIEPLQAFRGVREWSFDPEDRMAQKISHIAQLVTQITQQPSLPTHTITAHSSSRPTGRRGGWGHMKPSNPPTNLRYPTLASVAHSLPRDPAYRAQAMHAINTLERSRGWAQSDKIKAVNTLIEVLNSLGPSAMWKGKLDKALGNRESCVRRKPGNLLRRNRIRMYFRSAMATVPLGRRWTERRAKNVARSKKSK